MNRDADANLRARVSAALDRASREALGTDGGALELVDVDADRVVQVRLTGACASCPSTIQTLIFGLEAAVRAEVPEVRFLEAVP